MKEKKSQSSKFANNENFIKEEDVELWEKITRNVAPLLNEQKNTTKQSIRNLESSPAIKVSTRPIQKHSSIVETSFVSDWRTARNLKKGKISIEARLDLHGLIQSEAYEALNQFISQSYKVQRRCVLVITGKGHSGASQGVLRSVVPRWLTQSPNREKIIEFHQAAPRDGGEGALYVLLKRKR